MCTALRILSREKAIEEVILSLALPRTVTDLEFQFEMLRAITWALTGGIGPVHVLRLLNRAVEIAMGLVTNFVETEHLRADLRESLDILAEVGDLVELDGGYWLPAPTRFVEAHRDDHVLLVGGLPNRLLPTDLRELVSPRGPFRSVERSTTSLLNIPTEDLFDWARKPPEPLDVWAQRILEIDLPVYTEPRDGSMTLLYLPAHAHSGAPQFKRWFERYDKVEGRFLARRSRVFGAREYRLVEVTDGKLVSSGAVLGPHEARRLMYAFDARFGNPTKAMWFPRSTGGELVLNSVPPEPEQRILGAMGGSLSLNPEKVYQRRWIFSADGEKVLKILRDLSIDVRSVGRA